MAEDHIVRALEEECSFAEDKVQQMEELVSRHKSELLIASGSLGAAKASLRRYKEALRVMQGEDERDDYDYYDDYEEDWDRRW